MLEIMQAPNLLDQAGKKLHILTWRYSGTEEKASLTDTPKQKEELDNASERWGVISGIDAF